MKKVLVTVLMMVVGAATFAQGFDYQAAIENYPESYLKVMDEFFDSQEFWTDEQVEEFLNTKKSQTIESKSFKRKQEKGYEKYNTPENMRMESEMYQIHLPGYSAMLMIMGDNISFMVSTMFGIPIKSKCVFLTRYRYKWYKVDMDEYTRAQLQAAATLY